MDITWSFLKIFFVAIYMIAPLLIFLASVIIALGLAVGKFEKWTIFDSLYWSFITATTVGYGDIRPSKKRSRILSVFIAFVGLMFTGILVSIALIASSEAFHKHVDSEELKELERRFE